MICAAGCEKPRREGERTLAATMKDIARETGLGLATISSYFNGGNVRQQNRAKIEAAIEKLHYEVNEVARGLKTNETHTIGVVIPELNNIFSSEVLTGMEDVLRQHGYATIICDCRTDPEQEREAMEFLIRKRVDGLVNMPVDTAGNNLRSFQRTGKPMVLIDREIQGVLCDSVLVDNEDAAFQAVMLLIRNGHRNIGIAGGPGDVFTARERLKGYLRAHREAGIEIQESLIYHGDYTIRGGAKAVEVLLEQNPRMTALFVTNYDMTVGALIGLNERDVKIPEEISLFGFDNPAFAKACYPRLTIVSQPTEKIGQEAAKVLLRRLSRKEDQAEPVNIRLDTEIFVGKSVKNLLGAERLVLG